MKIDVHFIEEFKERRKEHKMEDAVAKVESAVNDLQTALNDLKGQTGQPTTGDNVLDAVKPVLVSAGLVTVFGADELVNELTAAGFTVTPPAA